MLDRLYPIPVLGSGDRRHLFAEEMDMTGATGRLALVPGASDLGEDLGNRVGHRGLPEIGARLTDPGTRAHLAPGVDRHSGRAAPPPQQAVIPTRAPPGLRHG